MVHSLLLLITLQGSDPCASLQPGAAIAARVVTQVASPRDTTVTATVCVVPARGTETKIGSYHGELHFDSTAVSLVRVVKTEGGVRVENPRVKGQVNFAGAAPAGFPGRALVTIVLRVPAGSSPVLRLSMKELNSTDGASLMKQLVVAGAPK